jgi:RNA polymerase sigma factor for flagellar operon FliA
VTKGAVATRQGGGGDLLALGVDVDDLDARARRREEIAELWSEWGTTRSLAVRNQLVEIFYPIAVFIARKMAATLSDEIARDDIEGYAAEGLIDAIEHFKPSHGTQFSTFAPYRIRGAVYDGIREFDWVSRSDRRRERDLRVVRDEFFLEHRRLPTRDEEASLAGLSLAAHDGLVARLASAKMTSLDRNRLSDGFDLDVPDIRGGLLTALLSKERTALLRVALETLSPREQRVILLMFIEGQSLAQVGDALGVSESRICQIRARALRLMRRQLASSGITEAREDAFA